MKNHINKKADNLLIVNSAIKSIDTEFYKYLHNFRIKLSEYEILLCLLLKYGYSADDILLFTGLSKTKLSVTRKNLFRKLDVKNESDLINTFENLIVKKEKLK